ncbi:hypothetical protein [Prevotella jejuni]
MVHFKETHDVNNETPMIIIMTFSAENISVGNAGPDNSWSRS